MLYGDDTAAPADAARRNLRGRRWRGSNPVGITVEERYDVHNNPQETVRRWLPIDGLIKRADLQQEPQLSWPPDDLSRLEESADNALADGMSLHVDQLRDRTGAFHALAVDGSNSLALTVRYTRDSTGDVTAVDVLQGHGPPGSAHRADHCGCAWTASSARPARRDQHPLPARPGHHDAAATVHRAEQHSAAPSPGTTSSSTTTLWEQ